MIAVRAGRGGRAVLPQSLKNLEKIRIFRGATNNYLGKAKIVGHQLRTTCPKKVFENFFKYFGTKMDEFDAS